MAEILHVLIEKGLKPATIDHLASQLYGASDGPEDARNTISVHVTNLRKRIAPLGWTVDISYGAGWRLVKVGEESYGGLRAAKA